MSNTTIEYMMIVFIIIVIFVLLSFKDKKEDVGPQNCPWNESWVNMIESIDKKVVSMPTFSPSRRPHLLQLQKIPYIIHQSHNKNKIPIKMKEAIDSVISMNPEYEHRYYDEDARRKFICEHFSKRVSRAYDDLIPGAYKCDLFRYCVLYVFGGVYLDSGFVAVNPLRNVITPDLTFLSTQDNPIGPKYLYNAFICATPQHPIIRRTIELALDMIERRDYGSQCLDITGPTIFGKACVDITGYLCEKDFHHQKGIKIGNHKYTEGCISGEIIVDDIVLFYTKYPGYRSDSKWYCDQEHNHYPKLWDEKRVFREL